MNGRPFDNIHPGLSQQEALRIISAPMAELEAASDYYMAAAHLINYPGPETEQALLVLLQRQSSEQALLLAQRKAVEVLARLGCVQAIPAIGRCLQSTDPYLVENAAWALQELHCDCSELHEQMVSLLSDRLQNRRVLIQSLASLGVDSAVSQITGLQDDDLPGVRGAALAAVSRLGGSLERVHELEAQLTLPNQMDRQSAIQDIIDCQAFDLLPSVMRAPVSPVFRMRAVHALWPVDQVEHLGLDLLETLDDLFVDEPSSLVLVHRYDEAPTEEFLLQEFFGTDFSRCYLALQSLSARSADLLWPLIWTRWQQEAHNDYGAHYFFVRLLGRLESWPADSMEQIEGILVSAIENKRPQFLKSKPAAILSLMQLNPKKCLFLVSGWLDAEQTPFWESRYAALLAIQPFINNSGWDSLRNVLPSCEEDIHPFVRAKARLLIDRLN